MDKDYRKQFHANGKIYSYYDIAGYLAEHQQQISAMPYSIRVLLELTLRHSQKKPAMKEFLKAFIDWDNQHDQVVA